MSLLELEPNPREAIGGNNPPEPTPFEQSKDEIEGLYLEAKNWLDKPVTSDEEEQALARLIEMLRKAMKTADERRKDEVRPFDEAKSEVQTRYNTLIGDTKSVKGMAVLALDAAKAALQPWLTEKDRKQREEAERKRREAEEAERAAREARAAADRYDLEAREQAERLERDAKEAAAAASRAEKAKPQATGGSRAIGLRTIQKAVVTDYTAFVKYMSANHKVEFMEWLDEQAQRLVNNKFRNIPGVRVEEEQRV